MKLRSVEYSNSNEWHSIESIPDNPREILIYTKDFGTTAGCYQNETNKWFSFRWQCFINPVCWREIVRYES